MKKANFITLSFLCVLMVVVAVVAILKKDPSEDIGTDTDNVQTQEEQTEYEDEDTQKPSNDTEPFDSSSNGTDITQQTDEVTKAPETEKPPVRPEDVSMDDALFIGDSRTVGIMEYAGISDADFFCDVGMSIYNINKKSISVSDFGKVSVTELLEKGKYGKIYVMLGVNEVGYDFNTTADKYGELIDLITEKQPDATVFIQANLHVSKKRSDKDKVVNNKAIDTLNAKFASFADGEKIFYMDVNAIFDDENGGLAADKSGDGTHPYAKYYKEWGKWIIEQTAAVM